MLLPLATALAAHAAPALDSSSRAKSRGSTAAVRRRIELVQCSELPATAPAGRAGWNVITDGAGASRSRPRAAERLRCSASMICGTLQREREGARRRVSWEGGRSLKRERARASIAQPALSALSACAVDGSRKMTMKCCWRKLPPETLQRVRCSRCSRCGRVPTRPPGVPSQGACRSVFARSPPSNASNEQPDSPLHGMALTARSAATLTCG